ncbi:hypothetical protein Trco_003362 [Trichoderma cornu-damae]|uniref:P-loop containing nucleoside triphosphate hydrolase protein n=1 Tax=Trichoderma cornu-damae TaxID=654480 RepID=A0A9P8QKX5_9HYPO|nr:hypothetical protein Trco_003362 [Trichoderma cornu-damae]
MALQSAVPPTNRLDVPPKSKVEYLGVHYKLYRYEVVEPLRKAISSIRQANYMMESGNVFIYTNVRVKGYMLSKEGACCRIDFSTTRSQKPVDWRDSDRLTPGTLVALSLRSDCFGQRCIVATVASRSFNGKASPDVKSGYNPKMPPQIELFWADPGDALINPMGEYIMLEAKSGYFENARYTMQGLQHAALYQGRLISTKLDKYVLGCPSSVGLASHLLEAPEGAVVVPEAASRFDVSQMEAFNSMTSREFSVVQGPPGTGKTFTSIVAIQSIIQTLNKCQRSRPAPIIIAAQTNHALDQLLKLCLDNNVGKIVRLGGQSRCSVVIQHSLFNLRSKTKYRKGDVEGQTLWKRVRAMVADFLEVFSGDEIRAELFRDLDCITHEQYQSLVDGYESRKGEADAAPGGVHSLIRSWLDFGPQTKTMPVNPMLPADRRGGPAAERYDDTPETDAEEEDGRPRGGQAPEDARFRLRGLFVPISRANAPEFGYRGSQRTESCLSASIKMLEDCPNLYDIDKSDRQKLYDDLRFMVRSVAGIVVGELLQEYKDACETLKINRWVNDLQIMHREGIQIIGCTTTGLAKYRGLLAAMMPRVMLIEEAAETREASVAAAMFPSLNQLILVGDHQQLTPHVDIPYFGAGPYNLHVSMFERLVKLGLPYKTLQVQRRMIPQLRSVVQTFYPMLKDHPTVMDPRNRPAVPGMGGTNLWWFQHQWPESRSPTFSYSNMREAQMVARLVRHLVLNGLEPSQITVLTYYNAQVDVITDLLRKNRLFPASKQGWSVRTVDGYQGEENDVVILSLVRSPNLSFGHSAAGFVEDENRAVVAISRARRGLYVFGNICNILQSGYRSRETWGKVFIAFGTQTGNYLPVTCSAHGEINVIRTVEEWSSISMGGCRQTCNGTCPNGHVCLDQCHAEDQDHLHRCRQACRKLLTCGHGCVMPCREECCCDYGCAANRRMEIAIRPPRPDAQRETRAWVDPPSERPRPRHRRRGRASAKAPWLHRPQLAPAEYPHPQRVEGRAGAARLDGPANTANQAANDGNGQGQWTRLTSEEMMQLGYYNSINRERARQP